MASPTQFYINDADVDAFGGRLAALWPNDAKSQPSKNLNLAKACAEVDRLSHQNGGFLLQTNKVYVVQVRGTGDALQLPNKPISNVSAISVWRSGVTLTYDVSAGQAVYGAGQTVKYHPSWTAGPPSGLIAVSYNNDGMWSPFVDGDEVTVTYSCGYAANAIPPAVKQAALIILEQVITAPRDNPGRAQETMQGRYFRQRYAQYASPMEIARSEAKAWLDGFICQVK